MASNQSDTEKSPKKAPPKSPSTTYPTLNPRSPFYVYPRENPGAILIAPPLDDNNYHNWSKSMRHALTSKNKIRFINSSLQRPSSANPNFDVWERANNMDELEVLRPTPTFYCTIPCTCDLSKVVRQYKQMEYVTGFIKGLKDTYHNIRTQILLLDPIPNISRLYSMIAQQEVTTTIPTIHYANNNPYNNRGKGRGNPKSSMVSTNCHRTNYSMETCYFKHGFPPGYRNKSPKNDSESKPHQQSEKDGIISKEDYQYLLQLLRKSKKDNSSTKTVSTTTHGPHIISGMVKTGSDLNSPTMWILDFGASDHVCTHS
ncbi:uncharacterized protein LOC131619329 [Vicia villosa]|uniref:uncharacterized protein LOC131619329 n=1 Tax=Vicia villosa TaxID=3911 RepID=UPI00273AED96|nr:uncharacterized protein LOC131619329 [Vicia villosa]